MRGHYGLKASFDPIFCCEIDELACDHSCLLLLVQMIKSFLQCFFH